MSKRTCWFSLNSLICLLVLMVGVNAQTPYDARHADDAAQVDAINATRQLANSDPLVRQHAAEDLAQLAATDQRRMVEGYRLQEKNTRVRLALDWALYRMGKSEALYAVVRALDSSRAEQAAGYLGGLETAQPLYPILPRVNGNTQVKLLEVLARIGDSATLEQLKPFTASFDPKIAAAAHHAEQAITQRVGQPQANTPARPRQVVIDKPPTP